jgi:hypothetical protein
LRSPLDDSDAAPQTRDRLTEFDGYVPAAQ